MVSILCSKIHSPCGLCILGKAHVPPISRDHRRKLMQLSRLIDKVLSKMMRDFQFCRVTFGGFQVIKTVLRSMTRSSKPNSSLHNMKVIV